MEKQRKGELPEDVSIKDLGNGVFKVIAKEELSFDEIVEFVDRYVEGNGDDK